MPELHGLFNKKARLNNTSSKKFMPGGSKLLMVIKHISSTPFSDSVFIELPEEISEYIDSKFTDISLTQDKIILQMKAQEFYRNIIWNSTPTLKTYVDDMHSSFLKTGTSSSSPNLQFKSALSENTFKVPRTKQLLAIQSPPNFPMLNVPTIIDEDKQVTIDEILQELVNDFPQSMNIRSSNFSLSFYGYLSESRSPKRKVEETKFSLPLFRFLLPGERLEDFVEPKLDKGWLLAEKIFPVDNTFINIVHGNSNGEAGTSTQYTGADCPSFDAITNSIDIVQTVPFNSERITSEPTKPFASGSSTQFSLPAN